MLHQYGFDCAVASLGTALTEDHAKILAKYTSQVVLTYDADSGVLSANVTYPEGGVKFENIQHPDSIEVIPTGKKTTVADNNNVPEDATFSFTVIDVQTGKGVGAGVGSANSQFQFSKLTYSRADYYNTDKSLA